MKLRQNNSISRFRISLLKGGFLVSGGQTDNRQQQMWRKKTAHITYGPKGKNNTSTQTIVPFSPCYCHIAGTTGDMRRAAALRNTEQQTASGCTSTVSFWTVFT